MTLISGSFVRSIRSQVLLGMPKRGRAASSAASAYTSAAMPQHWLLKSEPDDYSVDQLERDGWTAWDGVQLMGFRFLRKEGPHRHRGALGDEPRPVTSWEAPARFALLCLFLHTRREEP